MADVLSQSQIDALLKSMQGGGGDDSSSTTPAQPEQKTAAVQEEKKKPETPEIKYSKYDVY